MSELYDIKEPKEGTFPISFKLINRYHQEDPILMGKLTCEEYQMVSLHEGRNTIKLATYKDQIVIPHKLQKYVVK